MNGKVDIFFSGCHWGKCLHTDLPLATHWEWPTLQNQFRFVVKNIFSLKSYQQTYVQITETCRRTLSRCRDKKEAKCLYGNAFAPSRSRRPWRCCGWEPSELLTGQLKPTKVFSEMKFALPWSKSYPVKKSVAVWEDCIPLLWTS